MLHYNFYIYILSNLTLLSIKYINLDIKSFYKVNKRGYAPFKTHMVHFYIFFKNLASSATQGFIFLENQCTFLENKKMGAVKTPILYVKLPY
jgi:hypothetical protein